MSVKRVKAVLMMLLIEMGCKGVQHFILCPTQARRLATSTEDVAHWVVDTMHLPILRQIAPK